MTMYGLTKKDLKKKGKQTNKPGMALVLVHWPGLLTRDLFRSCQSGHWGFRVNSADELSGSSGWSLSQFQ